MKRSFFVTVIDVDHHWINATIQNDNYSSQRYKNYPGSDLNIIQVIFSVFTGALRFPDKCKMPGF
ncbi:hypothetical protein BZ160_19980 [Pantoea vagans]|jgi:hypothetical protein|nr:hypothetical protein BEE12_23295 [Pantoea agglomerans]MBB1229837.1 hypothetical protein [Pantoea pleuroti]OQV38648.1 hypothetical protein BZ160_19980 [Pantoea vagans]TSH79168.1 hypothetical protein FOV68_20960 [Pantoea sp. paga]KIC88278.1 hypothetical protein RN49_03855 [Pantoea agglomerans]